MTDPIPSHIRYTETVSAFGYEWKIQRVRSGRWVGVCDRLGITMEGVSRSEFFENAQEAVRLIEADRLQSHP